VADPRPGPTAIFCDHQEVAGKAHFRDHAELDLDAFLVLRRQSVRESPGCILLDLGPKQVVLRLAGPEREPRHPVHLGVHRIVGLDPLGDQQCGVRGARDLLVPELAHLGGALQVVAVAIELEACRIVERLSRLDAQEGRV
jgi:hypothetical protein